MARNTTKDIVVPVEVAEGLLEVLQQTRGRRAKTYTGLLKAKIKQGRETGIELPMPIVAIILRILLMAMLPDPFIHGIMMMLERL